MGSPTGVFSFQSAISVAGFFVFVVVAWNATRLEDAGKAFALVCWWFGGGVQGT